MEIQETLLGLDRDQLKGLMGQCFLSTKVTAKIIFPDRFFRPFSQNHDKIFEALDDDRYQKVLIIAHRGIGKTSTVNLAYPAKKILFREKQFIVPISCTADQATMQGENLKRELLSNKMITNVFGPMKSETFSKEMWVTQTGTAVMPRGSGQQVRGILYGDSRPDLIIVDDLEDAEKVKSDEQRLKLKKWFFDDVCNSVDRGSKNWKIVVIGTLLHEASLLAELKEDPDWHVVEIPLCDANYHSYWPSFMSDEDVMKLVDSYRRQGLLDSFYREYMGLPIAGESAKFKQENFRYYDDQSEEFRLQRRDIESIVILDPAKTTTEVADDTAIVGVSVNAKLPRLYLRDVDKGQMHPEQMYTRCFDMADRIGAKVIGIEVTSLNEFITYPLKTEMLRQRRYYDIVELKARGSKDERIAALVPFYRLGFVYHKKGVCETLEQQLLSFPKSKKDDVMDAVAYIVEMLELGERYFVPHDSEGKGEEEFKEVMEDDYPDEEPAMAGWRTA